MTAEPSHLHSTPPNVANRISAPPVPARNEHGPSTLLLCIIILTICAVGAVSTVLRTVLTPLLMGVLLIFLINPLVTDLDRFHIPRWLTYILICILGAAAMTTVGWLIQIQGNELKQRLPEYRKRSEKALDQYAKTLGMANDEGKFDNKRFGLAESLANSQDEAVKYVVGTSLELLELVTMAFFYLLFGLVETTRLGERMKQSLSKESASHLWEILESIENDMRRYLWTKTAVSLGMGATTAALGWMFGLDFWLLWGFLMFLANYVTYIGSIVACIPPMLVAFAQFESAAAAAGFCALLVVVRLVWIDWAEMKYSGKHVNVSPFLVLFSVALFGWMWGAVGMLLAVPLITTARIVLGSFPRTEFVASLISDLK